jgi:hypothetical protein
MAMKTMHMTTAIPRETALAICEEIRAENREQLFSLAKLRCWGCVTFSKGEAEKMCVSSRPGYRGCDLVNQRYDQQRWAGALKSEDDGGSL